MITFRKAAQSAALLCGALLVAAAASTAPLAGAVAPAPAPLPPPADSSGVFVPPAPNGGVKAAGTFPMYSAPHSDTYMVGTFDSAGGYYYYQCDGPWLHIRTFIGAAGDHYANTVAWIYTPSGSGCYAP